MRPFPSEAKTLRVDEERSGIHATTPAARAEEAVLQRLSGHPFVHAIEVAPTLTPRFAPRPGQAEVRRRLDVPPDGTWVRIVWDTSVPLGRELVMTSLDAVELALREAELLRERSAITARFESLRQRNVERDRLTAIGTMAAGVAHDIRNPLMVLTGNLSYLSDVASELPDVREEVESIVEDNRLALALIEGILDSMRSFVQMKETSSAFAIRPIIESAVRLSRWHMGREGVTVQLRITGEPWACATTGELLQILINLLSNAAAAAPSGSVVRIGAATRGAATHLWVADEGPGVPPDQAEAIFQPFHTSKPKGMGLGLSVAREMAERHRGSLRLVSESPSEIGPTAAGACFELVLPSGDEG
ncbi:MAG: HAMP domain-containing sensor histidine kinase [Sandaracinaceae bacterium]